MTDPAGLEVSLAPFTGTAELTWDPSTDPGLLDYSVFRRTSSTGEPFDPEVDTPAASGITDEFYTDSGLVTASYDWQVFARLFSPLDIAGLVAWYDASVPSSIHATAGRVSQWDDLSGNGHHLTNASGASQPLTGTDTINGLNVIKFDKARGDFLRCSGVTIAQPLTLLVVVKRDATDGGNAQILGNVADPESTLFNFDAGGGVKWMLYAGLVASGSISSANTNAHQLSALFNGASSGLWIDGAGSTLSGSPFTNGRTDIAVGNDAGGSGNGFGGDIAAVLLYDSSLSTGNRNSVEGLLKDQWATP